MTTVEFARRFTLHDSIVKRIEYKQENRELHMILDFCWWMQKDYDESTSAPDMIELAFHGVPAYKGLQGAVDDYSILGLETKDGEVSITLLDDYHDQQYKMAFRSDEVTMEPC